jgi:hypothetical protein
MLQNTQNNNFPKLGAPAERALTQAGSVWLEQLTKVTEVELGRLHGMGPRALKQLLQALSAKGPSFANAKPGRG